MKSMADMIRSKLKIRGAQVVVRASISIVGSSRDGDERLDTGTPLALWSSIIYPASRYEVIYASIRAFINYR